MVRVGGAGHVQNEELNSAHPMRKYARASRSGGWDKRVSCAALHGRSEDAGSIEGPIVSWPDRYMSCNAPRLRHSVPRSLTLSRALSHLSSRVRSTPPRSRGSRSPEEGPPTQPILSEVSAN